MPAETMHPTGGDPKPVATGKKGNVGGIATAGRHGRMIKGLTALMKPGPQTSKTAKLNPKIRPEGAVGSLQQMAKPQAAAGKASGSPKKITMSGHKGVHGGVDGPEPAVKRDGAHAVKPFSAANTVKA